MHRSISSGQGLSFGGVGGSLFLMFSFISYLDLDKGLVLSSWLHFLFIIMWSVCSAVVFFGRSWGKEGFGM